MREEKALDVLVYLYEEYLCEDDLTNFEALQTDLVQAGFDNANIEQAFSWLEGLIEAGQSSTLSVSPRSNIKSIRIYSSEERQHLSMDAQGFLHLLEQNELLDAQSREWVIERAMALQPEGLIDVEPLQWVVLFVLYHSQGKEQLFESYEGLFFSEDVMTIH